MLDRSNGRDKLMTPRRRRTGVVEPLTPRGSKATVLTQLPRLKNPTDVADAAPTPTTVTASDACAEPPARPTVPNDGRSWGSFEQWVYRVGGCVAVAVLFYLALLSLRRSTTQDGPAPTLAVKSAVPEAASVFAEESPTPPGAQTNSLIDDITPTPVFDLSPQLPTALTSSASTAPASAAPASAAPAQDAATAPPMNYPATDAPHAYPSTGLIAPAEQPTPVLAAPTAATVDASSSLLELAPSQTASSLGAGQGLPGVRDAPVPLDYESILNPENALGAEFQRANVRLSNTIQPIAR